MGFDPPTWLHGTLNNWSLELFETYNFLGKLDPSMIWWRKVIEGISSFLRPHGGSLFSFVARKPKDI